MVYLMCRRQKACVRTFQEKMFGLFPLQDEYALCECTQSLQGSCYNIPIICELHILKLFTVANKIQKKHYVRNSHFPLYSSVARVAAYGNSVSDSRIISLFHYSVLDLESTQWEVGTCSQEINFPSVKLTVYFYFPISIFFFT